MYRLKSIKLYFFSILKLFFLSFRNIYFKTNFYNKKLVTFSPDRIYYNPSTYLSTSLTTITSDFYNITNTTSKLLLKLSKFRSPRIIPSSREFIIKSISPYKPNSFSSNKIILSSAS